MRNWHMLFWKAANKAKTAKILTENDESVKAGFLELHLFFYSHKNRHAFI